MPEEKTIIFENIGKLVLKKDRRFKRLSIRIAPKKGIWINVPYNISYKEAISFALANKAWIQNNKQKVNKKENEQSIFTEETEFTTRFHKLKLSSKAINYYSSNLSNGILEVNYPAKIAIETRTLQDFIRKSIIETLKREANHYLPKRTKELANLHDFTYTSVHIKNTKSRWGSCTHDNKINLCFHLMRLPKELCDMVILHELCHTKIKNHSVEFYELLGQYCKNLKQKRKEIKNYSIIIF